MAYEKCPNCGGKKHELMKCQKCGYQTNKIYRDRTSTETKDIVLNASNGTRKKITWKKEKNKNKNKNKKRGFNFEVQRLAKFWY